MNRKSIESTNRIYWIDIAKILGIFFIYLGHMGDAAGLAYGFVFQFHVALFFFISGCMETKNNRNFSDNFIHKCRCVLIPFFLFFLLTIACRFFMSFNYEEIANCLYEMVLGGVRNHYGVKSLWFLSALFSTCVLFSIIKRVRNRVLILILSCGCYLMTQLLLPNTPVVTPSWIYNIDSALYYVIFYALGYVLFPYISVFLQEQKYKMLRFYLTVLLLLYSAFSFVRINPADSFFGFIPRGELLYQIVHPMILILMVCCVSYYLQPFILLRNMGKVTLYFCGNEYVVKRLLERFVIEKFSLQGIFEHQILTYTYVFFLMLVVYFLVAPMEQKFVRWIKARIDTFRE